MFKLFKFSEVFKFAETKTVRVIAYILFFALIILSKIYSFNNPEQVVNEQAVTLEAEATESLVPVINNYNVNVKRVVDGDTFVDDKNKRYRIAFIDAPEVDQEYGSEATDFLKALIENKTSTVKELYKDKYERNVVIVFLDEIDIAEILVQYGYAWNQANIYNADKDYAEKLNRLELIAKENKAGIWSFWYLH